MFSAATGMKWIEVKMKELGVTSHTEYKICFMIDSGAMISVHSPKYGVMDVSSHIIYLLSQNVNIIVISVKCIKL